VTRAAGNSIASFASISTLRMPRSPRSVGTSGRLALLVLLALPLPTARAGAQSRWREIGTTSSGNPVFIDARSVKRDGKIVTATVRVKFLKPVATPKGAITSSRTVAMFDCATRRVAVKENTYFHDEAKGRVYQKSINPAPGYGSPIKGALPDVALTHFCAAPSASGTKPGAQPSKRP